MYVNLYNFAMEEEHSQKIGHEKYHDDASPKAPDDFRRNIALEQKEQKHKRS